MKGLLLWLAIGAAVLKDVLPTYRRWATLAEDGDEFEQGLLGLGAVATVLFWPLVLVLAGAVLLGRRLTKAKP